MRHGNAYRRLKSYQRLGMFTKVHMLLGICSCETSKNSMFTSGTANIEKPILNSLLGRHLASSLCRTLDNCKIYKDQDIDLDRIMSVSKQKKAAFK